METEAHTLSMAEAEHSKQSKPGRQKTVRKPDEEPVGKVYDSGLMLRLARYLRPYWVQATISAISVSIKSLCDVIGPYLVKVAIDRYMTGKPGPATSWLTRRLPENAYQGITELSAIFLGTLLAAYLFEFVQTYLMQWTGQKIMFDLRREIFRHMQGMHVGFFDTNPVGRLVTRLTSDVDAINDMFTDGILSIVNDAFTLTIMAGVMLAINWWLALLAFAVLPLILIVTRLFRDHVRESYRRVRAAIARINSFTQEHITGSYSTASSAP
jgi:ATP-binding cassette subfamily B protein